jgi:hypothetical protein
MIDFNHIKCKWVIEITDPYFLIHYYINKTPEKRMSNSLYQVDIIKLEYFFNTP